MGTNQLGGLGASPLQRNIRQVVIIRQDVKKIKLWTVLFSLNPNKRQTVSTGKCPPPVLVVHNLCVCECVYACVFVYTCVFVCV